MTTISGALEIANTALRAGAQRQANIAHNVANAATNGFRGVAVSNQSLVQDGTGRGVTTSNRVAAGPQGPLVFTGTGTDLGLSGDGFFLVEGASGDRFLTREGSFRPDAQGVLRNASGFALVAEGAGGALGPVVATGPVQFGADGTISETGAGGTQVIGRLTIATVPAPSGLQVASGTVLRETAASGPISLNAPGTGGAGQLITAAVEGSNVDLGQEAVNTIANRAAFSANVASAKVAASMTDALLDLKA